METKINITTILKNKPKGTKLYSTVHGKCTFEAITDEIFKINFCTSKFGLTRSGECTLIKFGNMYDGGECIIFPSKEMRDWSKFAWKKGDVLVSKHGTKEVIFDSFDDDYYVTFKGKHALETIEGESEYKGESDDSYNYFYTEDYYLESEDAAQTYINTLEKILGGKLNRETLEIEKQLEFKDGDIVFMKGIKGGYFANCIFILRSEYKDGDERAFYYAFYNADDKFTIAEYGYTRVHYSLRPATDSEKQQLFDALAKKNKRWDSEKKQIVDLPKNCEFKPFDKVLVRQRETEEWRANIFSHTDKTDEYLDYVIKRIKQIPFKSKDGSLYVCGNCKHRCV